MFFYLNHLTALSPYIHPHGEPFKLPRSLSTIISFNAEQFWNMLFDKTSILLNNCRAEENQEKVKPG